MSLIINRAVLTTNYKLLESLSIDCVIFGFNQAKLKVLEVKHGEGISEGKWALPGEFIRYNEDLDESAYRILKDLTGVTNIFLEQLKAFGTVERYPNKRVITIAYYALVNAEDYELVPGFIASDARWVDLTEVGELPYDHNQILSFSYEHLRHKIRYEPVGFNLLPKKFTLLQLQELYEAILGIKLDKPNFRRKLMKMNLLKQLDEKQTDVAHRAANLYEFDEEVYRHLSDRGFNFEL